MLRHILSVGDTSRKRSRIPKNVPRIAGNCAKGDGCLPEVPKFSMGTIEAGTVTGTVSQSAK